MFDYFFLQHKVHIDDIVRHFRQLEQKRRGNVVRQIADDFLFARDAVEIKLSSLPSEPSAPGAPAAAPGPVARRRVTRATVSRRVTRGEEAARLIPSESIMRVTASAPRVPRLFATSPPAAAPASQPVRLTTSPTTTPSSSGLRRGAVHAAGPGPVPRPRAVDTSRMAKAPGDMTSSWSSRIGAMAVASPSRTMRTGIPRLAALTYPAASAPIVDSATERRSAKNNLQSSGLFYGHFLLFSIPLLFYL